MGKCLFMRKGETHTAPVNFNPVFANNTWEQIVEACQKNKVPETWSVGDQKTMKINGTDYTIDIIGKNHDTYSDGSGKAPLTFQMHDCYETTYVMNPYGSNNDGWSKCVIRTTHLPSILALMPSEVQVGIKEVNKLTGTNGSDSTIVTTKDKLFLLSEIEVFNSTEFSYVGEGQQYDYYRAGNTPVKTYANGQDAYWWLRSPQPNTTNYAYVDYVLNYGSSTKSNAISFAFCF